MYIESLNIKNLRCFGEASLKLNYPGRKGKDAAPECSNINLLLGDNGAGKTTVLRAVALSTLAPVVAQASGFVPERLIRRTSPEDLSHDSAEATAEVLLHSQDGEKGERVEGAGLRLTVQVVRRGDREIIHAKTPRIKLAAGFKGNPSRLIDNFFNSKSPAFFVVGYSARRRVEVLAEKNFEEQLKRRDLRYQRVAGLFEDHIALIPIKAWLPRMRLENRGRYTQVVHLIDRLLPEEAEFDGRFEEDEYYFRVGGAEIPFGALSDGYRSYVGWVADLLYHVCMGCPSGVKLVENRGIVLVDEIDLHLHPEWQRTVIERLSTALPNLQFIFSTHSPIVAGSLHKENIFVMESDFTGTSTVSQFDERIFGLNSEQILLSSYFGLRTTRAAAFERELHGLAQKAHSGKPADALAYMQKLNGASPPAAAKARGVDLGEVDAEQLKLLLSAQQQQGNGGGARKDGAKRGAKRGAAGARKKSGAKARSRASKKR